MTPFPMSGRVGAVGGMAGDSGVAPATPIEPSSGADPASRRRPGQAQHYPRQSSLVLGALPSAVPCARLHARQVVWEWGLNALAEVVELVVSELVTNAVQASEALRAVQPYPPTVQFWLHASASQVLIQVWDAFHLLPTHQEPALDEEHGRGLLLVESLSVEWGAYRLEGGNGKVVWARVGLTNGDSFHHDSSEARLPRP